jgi:hypothetical protein
MSSSFQRTLRELRLPALVALSLGIVAALAWSTHRLEMSGAPTPSRCSRLVDEAFGIEPARTPDSVLLARLLTHRPRCTGDATYVDQARRLMLNVQRVDDARRLIGEAERSRAFTPDQLATQRTWVDLEEAREALLSGDVQRGTALHARALVTTKRLRTAWPEWEPPYRILSELERIAPNDSGASPAGTTQDQFAMLRAARQRVTTGAFVRSLTSHQTIATVCALAAIGLLAFGVAVSGIVAIIGMQRMKAVPVADARAGYVELEGTLHLSPRADAVIGPLSKVSGVWYSIGANFGSKGSHMWRERSAQRFLLRDATGEVAIDPSGAVVLTRHSQSRFGSSAFLSRRWETERMLREGDQAYVVGELSLEKRVTGVVGRTVRAPADGRRLLVSNYTEAELIAQERMWIWSGTLVFLLTVMALAWGYAQRYGVPVAP